MKITMIQSLVIGVLLAAMAGASAASDQAATSVPEILQMQHAIRTKLERPTGEYARLSPDAIARMEAAQDKVFAMLSGVNSIDQLNVNQRVEVSNALDEVKAGLLANEDNRLICHVERPTGSNISKRFCETVGQRKRDSDEARRMMRNNEIGR